MTVEYETFEVGHRVEERVSIAQRVTGAEPIPWSFTPGRRWVVTGLRVTFYRTRRGDEPWSAWSALSGSVAGHNVTASGQQGAYRTERLHTFRGDAIRAHLAEVAALLTEQGPDAVAGLLPQPDPVEAPREV